MPQAKKSIHHLRPHLLPAEHHHVAKVPRFRGHELLLARGDDDRAEAPFREAQFVGLVEFDFWDHVEDYARLRTTNEVTA